jgi:hypothetical protein
MKIISNQNVELRFLQKEGTTVDQFKRKKKKKNRFLCPPTNPKKIKNQN